MRSARPASEAEVVLAFLRGESKSARFGDATTAALDAVGGVSLVRDADITSDPENDARRTALTQAKGWASDSGLFAGFPPDVTWFHGILEPDELERVRYINYSYWVELSGGSRRPSDVLATLQDGRVPPWLEQLGTAWCFDFASSLQGNDLGDLIIVGTPAHDRLVALEGHARLTALFIGSRQLELEVHAYVGTSPRIEEWALF